MPNTEDEWSDSDEEELAEVETSVLLGVPDGPITAAADVNDAAVSRIGGHPAFLPATEPPFASSHCKNCLSPAELLVQMWCPFEDSPMDRALYIWGCARGGCQGKPGSIRAWRGIRYNEKYAAKLEQKLARRREKEKAKAEAQHKAETPKSNPFSLNNTAAPNPFGLGAQIFGDAPPVAPPEEQPVDDLDEEEDHSDAESDASSSSEQSLLVALATATIEESLWKSAPAYPPLYLSTVAEYLPPPPKAKASAGAQVQDDIPAGKDSTWAFEAYENSMEVDHVFERFTKRVTYEAEQCVRYELKGTPLPFASDEVFNTLFPLPPVPPLPVTKPDFKVVPVQRRSYDTSSVPVCSFCKSRRVFECQLMPNLINVLRAENGKDSKKLTDEERRKAVEAALKGSDKADKIGMEWGTCMIFSCEKDCCVADDGEFEARDCWREEVVLLQRDV